MMARSLGSGSGAGVHVAGTRFRRRLKCRCMCYCKWQASAWHVVQAQTQTQAGVLLQVAGKYMARGSESGSGSGARVAASGRQIHDTRLILRLRCRHACCCKWRSSAWHVSQTQVQVQVRVLLQVAGKCMTRGSGADSGALIAASGRRVHSTGFGLRLRFRCAHYCKWQTSTWHAAQTQAQVQELISLQGTGKYMAHGSDSGSGAGARVAASGRQVHGMRFRLRLR